MNATDLSVALTLIRYLLAAAGSAIVTRGLMTTDEWQLLSGAVVTAAPIIWGIVVKLRTNAAVKAVPSDPTGLEGRGA